MRRESSLFHTATLTLLGTIIGAGIFGLPAMFLRVGFWPGTLLFVVLTGVVLLTHLFYAEIILHQRGQIRFIGAVKKLLGERAALVATLSHPLQLFGLNIAYLLLGGQFLWLIAYKNNIFSDWGSGAWAAVFFIAGSLTVFTGLRWVAKVERVATWLLILTMITVIAVLFRSFGGEAVLPPAKWPVFMLPFGVFLLALSGFPVIRDLVELTERRRKPLYAAIIFGTLGAALLSWVFGVAFAIVSQNGLGSDPVELGFLLPASAAWLIPVVGFLAVATSYITMSDELAQTLRHDLEVSRWLACALALGIPFIGSLLFVGKTLQVIAFIGTAFSGLNGALIGWMAWQLFAQAQNQRVRKWRWLTIPVLFAYTGGMIYHLFQYLFAR